MKIERAKNAGRNIFYGIILKLYQIIIPFFMRTAIIYFMGIQYLGLNSLFTSILQVLNLAELGVGSAMVFSMYKPIAEDDASKICMMMKLYKTYYFIIGMVVAVIGFIIMPFLPYIIKNDAPKEINIYFLYLLNLASTVLSYWMFAYKNSLLQAHQRIDVINKVTIVTNTIQYLMQFIIIWLTKNYYLFVFSTLVVQILNNIIIAVVVSKLYPNYKAKGRLANDEIRQINQKIKDLFTAKLGSVVVGAVDTIVISAFLGLKILAVYQNYYFIVNAICGFINMIFSAVIAGIGNSLVTESMEKNYNDLKKFTFIISWILCICCCCFLGLFQPFMKIWVGKELILPYGFVIVFVILFYVLELAMVWATIKDAAGLWHADRFRPLAGALTNVILNIILVQIIGLYGIMLSTVISYVFVSMPWLIYNLFRLLYKSGMKKYLVSLFLYFINTIISCIIVYVCCDAIHVYGVIEILLKAVVCICIPNVVQLLLLGKTEEFREALKLVRAMRH